MAEANPSKERGCCTSAVQAWALFFWVFFFAPVLANLAKLAITPLQKRNLTEAQWAAYAGIVLAMFSIVGLGVFQRSWSPMVVRRSGLLTASSPCHEIVLAPFFSAGLFAATPTRLVKAWLLMFVLIPGFAVTVPHLSYPWRESVDAGVVVALGWGTLVVVVLGTRALLTGRWPDIDPDLPASRDIMAPLTGQA